MDSDEEEDDFLLARPPTTASAPAVAHPPQPQQPPPQQFSQPPAHMQAPPVAQQQAWRPGSGSQLAATRPTSRPGYGHQDVRATARSHEYTSEVGRWSRRSTQDDRGPAENGYAHDDSYGRADPYGSRQWRSRSRGMSMDEYPHREHRRELDDEEEQRRALARARAEREALERQRERLRSAESDDMRRYEDTQPDRWRSGSRDSYGDAPKEAVQPRRILVNDKPASAKESTVGTAQDQPTQPTPSLATRSLVDPSRPYASMFARPASASDSGKEEQSIGVEQLASDTHMHDRHERSSKARQLFDHKSGQMVDAVDRPPARGASESTWKRASHSQPVAIKAADHEERRKRREEREAKKRMELQQAEERRQAFIKEREEEAQRRKEARAKERAEREPRTKGMLFRHTDDGRIERVFTAREKEERERYMQERAAKIKEERAKQREERQKAREEKEKAREERRAQRQADAQEARAREEDARRQASAAAKASSAQERVDKALLENPPIGSGVVVVEAQTGIVHDPFRSDESFEEVKPRRSRQHEKKEERKPTRKPDSQTRDMERKHVPKEQQRVEESTRAKAASPVQDTTAQSTELVQPPKPKAPTEPAWRGDRSIHEVLGVKPSTPPPEPELSTPQPPTTEETQAKEPRAERRERASKSKEQKGAKESKKSKKVRPQGVYRPKAAAADAPAAKGGADDGSETMPVANIKQWKPKSSQRKPTRSDSLDHDPAIDSIAATAESVAKIATEDNDDEPVLNNGNEPEFVPSGSSLEQQLRDVQGSRGNSPRPEVWRQPSPVGDEIKQSPRNHWQRDHQQHHHSHSRSRWSGPMMQPQQSDAPHEAALSTHPLSDLQDSIFDAVSWQPTSLASSSWPRPESYSEPSLPWSNRLSSSRAHGGDLPDSLGTWSNFALNQSASTTATATATVEPASAASHSSSNSEGEGGSKKSRGGEKRTGARSQERTDKRSRKQNFKSAEPRPKRLARSRSTPTVGTEEAAAATAEVAASAEPDAQKAQAAPTPRAARSPRHRNTGDTVDKEKKSADGARQFRKTPKQQRWEQKKSKEAAPAAPAEAKAKATATPAAAPAPAPAPTSTTSAASAPAQAPSAAKSQQTSQQTRSPRPKRDQPAAAKKTKSAAAPRKRYVVKQPAPDKA